MQEILSIPKIPIYVSLGCGAEERANPQKVEVSLRLQFLYNNLAKQSDELTDSICYASLSEQVEKIAQKKSYKMIEHMGFEIFKDIKERCPNTKIEIIVFKVQPPHRLLQNGVYFTFGDVIA